MGSLSNRPSVPHQPKLKAFIEHENLKECHAALEHLSKLGELSLRRTPKNYTIALNHNGYDLSFRGDSLCVALQGLLKKVEE